MAPPVPQTAPCLSTCKQYWQLIHHGGLVLTLGFGSLRCKLFDIVYGRFVRKSEHEKSFVISSELARRRQRRRGALHIQWTLLFTVSFVILSLFKLELAVTSEEEEETTACLAIQAIFPCKLGR